MYAYGYAAYHTINLIKAWYTFIYATQGFSIPPNGLLPHALSTALFPACGLPLLTKSKGASCLDTYQLLSLLNCEKAATEAALNITRTALSRVLVYGNLRVASSELASQGCWAL
ncbi:hypothetical protein NDU88_002317 [Pleurodeles waltl]|uniref:Uncharacterized protein n=1 Tax=Pleurodeles waltl TaxID=8319 RepID=A0AAV7NI93_PLEWA|nr:hypothetical protein NDU88_002317 [Pleurodeles waltl]